MSASATSEASLTELSGGQRSLIALSLVLSLLRPNRRPSTSLTRSTPPSLSHTQNIGKMIKAHFKQSQFLVVSSRRPCSTMQRHLPSSFLKADGFSLNRTVNASAAAGAKAPAPAEGAKATRRRRRRAQPPGAR